MAGTLQETFRIWWQLPEWAWWSAISAVSGLLEGTYYAMFRWHAIGVFLYMYQITTTITLQERLRALRLEFQV